MQKRTLAFGALAAVAVLGIMGAASGGFPSRPRFQEVSVISGTAATGTPVNVCSTQAAATNECSRLRVSENGDFRLDFMNDARTAVSATPLSVDRTGATADSVTLAATAINLNGTANVSGVPIVDSGSFTATLTGYATPPTGTVQYRRSGHLVTLMVAADIHAISNATSMTITGLPAAIQPTVAQMVPAFGFKDDGFPLFGFAGFNAGSGTINAHLTNIVSPDIRSTQVNFNSSGFKGLSAGWTVTYALN